MTTITNNNNNNNMQDLEAWFETDAKKAAKVSTPISFEIAKEAGVAITKEGPVAYEAGHYLVSNGLSPAYPVAPAAFGALYDISTEQQGVATPKAIEKMAKLATDEGSITTSWGVLAYRSGMDYIVRHADGDYGVIAMEIFDVTYYVINRQPKRPREESDSDSDSDSEFETTKAYDSHKKICSARSSNISLMHGGAYLEDGVGYCTLCDKKL